MAEKPNDARARAAQVYERLREEMRSEWHRDLPLEELLFDRWERATSLGFGEGASIYHNSYVYGDVTVGAKTWVGPYTLLDGTGGGLSIGSYCNISAGVQIYTHDTVAWVLSEGREEYEHAPVSIGDCCHIGSNTVIGKGCSVGDHSVIGAQSFVNGDIPPYTVAFGAPCRPRGRVEVSDDGVRLVMDGDR